MNNKRACALVSGLLLMLTACGGGTSAEDEALSEAIAAEWTEDETFPAGFSIECAADGFVSGLGGAEGAAAYGVTVESIGNDEEDDPDVSESDARAMVANMFDCDGFEGALLSDFAGDATEEQASCLADNVDDAPLQALLASSFMGDGGEALEGEFENTFETQLFAAIETCGVDF